MGNIKIRKNSRVYILLKNLALTGGVLIIGALSPKFGAQIINNAIVGYFRNKKLARGTFLRDLKRLQIRKLIHYQEMDNGQIKITLTRQGKEKTLQFDLDNIRLNSTQQWDGEWRLIMFDIPHRYKKARDALRQKLNELKFYPLQKSVFITPYPCEDEIDFIASIFDIRKYILLIYVSRFEGEEKLRRHFDL